MWNLLCSKTIYIKGKKKSTNGRQKKKTVATVATVPPRTVATVQKKKKPHQSTVTATMLSQCKHIECTVPKHCSGIAAFYIKIIISGFLIW